MPGNVMTEEIKEIHLRQDSFEQRLFQQGEMINEIRENQKQILLILTPISDTYRAATTLRKWLNGFFVAIATLAGVFLSIREVYTAIQR